MAYSRGIHGHRKSQNRLQTVEVSKYIAKVRAHGRQYRYAWTQQRAGQAAYSRGI